jgi:hypothetical protein
MSGDASPNLGTSDEARELKIRQAAEVYALLALRDEAEEEMDRHRREMARIMDERCGLLFEANDAFEDVERLDFKESVLADIESLPETPGERREDGSGWARS